MLRTDDARFADLPGFACAPHYAEIDGMRMHYVDEGPRDAEVTALCLHGQPSWAYLYRKMIPVFAAAGLRVVAPDWFGFGRSDKPEDDRLVQLRAPPRLDAGASSAGSTCATCMLVVQDWGGLLGLTLPLDEPERYTRLLVMNTGLGLGAVTEGFKQWRAYANRQPDLACGKLIQRGTPGMTAAEAAAYDAPFPDMRYKAGVRAFPNLVPDREDAPGAELSRRAAAFWKEQWAATASWPSA